MINDRVADVKVMIFDKVADVKVKVMIAQKAESSCI